MTYMYDPFTHTYLRNTLDVQLAKDIQKAIHGEYSAIECYGRLARMTQSQTERNQILEIRQDEIRHFDEFRKIYTNITGMQPMAEIKETCPNGYKDGLEFAFKDEQETVDFYLDIADKAQNPIIKETFRRAAADEQNHAVWFLYFLHDKQTSMGTNRQNTNFGAKGALNTPNLTFPQMLTFALQDEYLAQARYQNILQTFGEIRTFTQIKEAELRHIYALLPLFERYQVPIPADTSQAFVTTPRSVKEAFGAGVQGEIENISMYDRFLANNIPTDARTIFTRLRDASQNHLAAFRRGLGRRN